MGIPSYYKKLVEQNPGLIKSSHPEEEIDWLFMDYNCLIYHCLHREDILEYKGESEKDEWETQFLESIVQYTLKIIKTVSPKKGVFIAIDGVVPMAKMRQQRLRRFKSSWLSKQSSPKWNTNSITPGTLFMQKLHHTLEHMIKKYGKKTWTLSSSNEPGEGEHKIISQWRTGKYSGNFAIYGLDADLIVLSLLGYQTSSLSHPIWLFREEINKGQIVYQSPGEESFEWFSIPILYNWLTQPYSHNTLLQSQFILNYCFSMSILGNDFLPSSLCFKIRDEGHSELLLILHHLMSSSTHLIDSSTLTILSHSLQSFFHLLSTQEPQRILSYILKKHVLSRSMENNNDLSYLTIGNENYPLSHIEEKALLNSDKKLSSDWKEQYLTCFFKGFQYNQKTITQICQHYLYGIQWIWSYYLGQSSNICFNWYYPYSLPPLWEWLSTCSLPSFPQNIYLQAHDIKPSEQLALVLPLDSWNLIPPCPEKQLPLLAPQFYPQSFSFDTIGKRYFWECESNIPLPTILQIKNILSLIST